MKVFAIFMAAWVLVCSLLPCNDVDDHTHFASQSAHVEDQLLPDCHSETGMEVENCAPFCHCNCCQSSTTIHDANLFLPLVLQGMVRYPALHDQFSGEHPASVWHPPIA